MTGQAGGEVVYPFYFCARCRNMFTHEVVSVESSTGIVRIETKPMFSKYVAMQIAQSLTQWHRTGYDAGIRAYSEAGRDGDES